MTSEPLPVERPLLGRLPATLRLGPLEGAGRLAAACAAAFAIFAAILLLDGNDPVQALRLIWEGSVGSEFGRSEILVKLIPFVLCAAAVAIPARVGLINVGGEGQFYMGAWAAALVALYSGITGIAALPLVFIAGAVGGGIWAGIPALLRVRFNLNEALSTLLLNFIADLIVKYFVYGPWKAKAVDNFPQTAVFPGDFTLPVIYGQRVHAGFLLVPLALVALFVVMRYTRAGFEMRAVGGNPVTARRAGIPVRRYLFWALVAGGMMAGLAGMAEVSGIQNRLRPGISLQFGFIGFLASWLGGHRPLGILVACLLFGAISVGGDTLQFGADLPGSTVNILMALMLFAVLAGRKSRAGVGA